MEMFIYITAVLWCTAGCLSEQILCLPCLCEPEDSEGGLFDMVCIGGRVTDVTFGMLENSYADNTYKVEFDSTEIVSLNGTNLCTWSHLETIHMGPNNPLLIECSALYDGQRCGIDVVGSMCTEIPSTHIMPNALTVPVTSKAVTLPLTTYTKPPFPVSHTATVPYDALSKGTAPYDVLSTVTTPYDALSTGTTPYDVLSTVTPPYDDLSTIVASETGDGNPMLKLAGAAMLVLFLVGVAGMIA